MKRLFDLDCGRKVRDICAAFHKEDFGERGYAELEKRFRASTCRKLSDHIRRHLFNKPIVATYRNQSLDELMEETAVLTSELRAIGNNINQIARKINTLKTVPEFKGHLYLFEIQRERLFDKMEEVSGHTQKIAEKWLQ